MQWIRIMKTNYIIQQIEIYPLDSVIHRLIILGLAYSKMNFLGCPRIFRHCCLFWLGLYSDPQEKCQTPSKN